MILDHCNYKLSVGFEKFSINVSLHSYAFGEEKEIEVNGVVRLRLVFLNINLSHKRLLWFTDTIKVFLPNERAFVISSTVNN